MLLCRAVKRTAANWNQPSMKLRQVVFPISLVSFLLVTYERAQGHLTALQTRMEKADVETLLPQSFAVIFC